MTIGRGETGEMRITRQSRWQRGQTAISIMVMAVTGGCDMFGWTYNLVVDPFVPKPLVLAEHDMSERRILIWVDDMVLVRPHPRLRRELTLTLAEKLIEHKAVLSVIGYDQIAYFRRRNPDFNRMSIQELGQKFEVDAVLYVLIEEFQWAHPAGEGYYQSQMEGYLKVIEAETGNRLWPGDRTSSPLRASNDLSEGFGAVFEKKLLRQFAGQLAGSIALRFYDHREGQQ